ncbi:MAG: transporter substrate-binding domain-containing protein, partial [Phycisphaerales bacterium]
MRLGLLSLVIALGLFGADASAATLDRIMKSGVIKIAYRVDAAPYSYKDAIGEPSGYTVDLCRAVTASLKGQLGLQKISIEYVPVTAENRFEMIQQGRADMLCGATTATLSRRALI